MVDYLGILRLKHLGCSQRNIISSLHCSCHTIKDVVDAAAALNLEWPFDKDITNQDLQNLLFPDKHKPNSMFVEPDYAYVHKELAKQGVNLTLLWEEYCQQCALNNQTPYMYTQFAVKYNKWARITKATMRIKHKPGDAIEIDWAGDTIPYYDSVTGEEHKAYLFIAVLPCSCYVYAEAVDNMQTENWLGCHINAFKYFDGVARLLIPDNCKTSTTENSRYDTILNHSYQELAEHYGTAIVPARVRRPQDKSHAEGSVRYAETWIIASLRNYKFLSLLDVQKMVAEKLEELNARNFQKRPGNRRSAYYEEEKSFMLPLPTTPYEPAVWTKGKVPADYLITDGINKYSVPFNLIGEHVDIRVTRYIVEAFFNGSRVASHFRLKTPQRDPIVKEEHMPEEHRKYLYYNEGAFKEWAQSVGEFTSKVVEYFLTSGSVPEQGFKACVSLNKLATRYSEERIEKACERILMLSSSPNIRNISTILKNGQDRITVKGEPVKSASSNKHSLTRGAAYFSRGGDSK